MAKTRVDKVIEDIRERIEAGQYAAHERIPSELKLQAQYGVSGDTVRKALGRLVSEGVVYRLPWKGTFASPPAKVGRIIIVANYASAVHADNFGLLYGFSAFEHGLRCYENRCELSYALISMDSDAYMQHAHEIHLIHQNLAGILFFRDIKPVLATRLQLTTNEVPFLFYGSDRYHGQLIGENSYCYEEEFLVSTALEYLAGKNHERILCTLSDSGTRRYQLYKTWMCKHGLWSDTLPPIRWKNGKLTTTPEELLQGTAILGTRDREALEVLNVAVRAGISVPESLAVMGIDNYPVGMHSIVPLTSVDIPIAADAERCLELLTETLNGKKTNIQERSKVRIAVRESA